MAQILGKAMMAVHGVDVGDPRTPLRALSVGGKADIVRRLRDTLG